MKHCIFLICLFFALTSCDKVEDPFEGVNGRSFSFDENVDYIVDPSIANSLDELKAFIDNNDWDSAVSPSNENQRFILLEEFTGHTCTFCPNGTREIVRLDDIYGDQLIPVGIHAGNFAIPYPNGSEFTTDFRASGGHGETYLTTFNVSGYPSGVVSRLGNASGLNNWEQNINSIKNDPPLASLSVKSYSSDGLNAIRAEVKVKWKQTLAETYHLQLYLVEDGIVDFQLDNGVINPNYTHRHVLRMVINDTFGKELKPATNGEEEAFQYIFPINSNWNKDHMEVVAFVFVNGNQGNYECIQANSSHVK